MGVTVTWSRDAETVLGNEGCASTPGCPTFPQSFAEYPLWASSVLGKPSPLLVWCTCWRGDRQSLGL